MPIFTSVDHVNRMVHGTALGRVTAQEVDEHLKLERHFNGLVYPEIIDARVANLDLSPEDVRSIVALVRTMSVENKFGPAAVIVYNDVAFGVVWTLGVLVNDVVAIAPFRSEVEAQAWLNQRQRNKS